MKTIVYDIKGEKKGEMELPKIFNSKIREDIVQKYYEVIRLNLKHVYANYSESGKRHSASGTISHQRHDWKGHYGKGMSRVPRKTMWRRGTQFYWIGAEVSGTRGGRRAHPPRAVKNNKKFNKKEKIIAFHSALAATASAKYIERRYATLGKLEVKMPVVIEYINKIKSKELIGLLKKIFGNIFRLIIKNKKVRAGKGKLRGRRYKSNAGILLIKSKDENVKMKGINIKSANEISVIDLYPLGRLAVFTKKALEELK